MSTVAESSWPEKVSPFLKKKMEETKAEFGEKSPHYQDIARQFLRNDQEYLEENSHARLRHYNADMHFSDSDDAEIGMERLYRRTMLLELTTVCFAHCRWCLRSNYHNFTLSKEQIRNNIALLSDPLAKNTVTEVLITGGDPLVSPQRLDYTLEEITRRAPHVKIVRIGTRIFTQNPEHIDDYVVEIFAKHRKNLRLEIGTQINSPHEFWSESVDAIKRLQDCGVIFYNQHPLLKGVNDNIETLVALYDKCREHAIESHYLFHCVPMRGMEHHRTTVAKGLELIRALTSGGYFSGRSKPHYACMTDIGKIVLYQGCILDKNKDTNELLLQSSYKIEDRRKYNPGFGLTDAARVDDDGYLQVWYPDGDDR